MAASLLSLGLEQLMTGIMPGATDESSPIFVGPMTLFSLAQALHLLMGIR